MSLFDAALSVTPEELDTTEVRANGLYQFVKLAWSEIDPAPFIPNWHVEQMCLHLEAVSRGELRRLIINLPPGMSKSKIVSVLWPCWDWIQKPSRKWIVATCDPKLAWRDALECRRLVKSQWFQARWPQVQIDDSDDTQTTQSVFNTTKGGRRVSTSVRQSIIGWHADIQVVDDPNKPSDMADPVLAASALERSWSWFTGTLASRRIDPKKLAQVIIMQRLSESDLVGRILEEDRERGEWTHLMLPMRFESSRACSTQWGGDQRSTEGELLCPARFDESAVQGDERRMGSQVAAAQLQQRPAPESGNTFKREWFAHNRWIALPKQLTYVISGDCSFKDSAGADFVSLLVWGYGSGKYYLVDRIHERLGLPGTVKCLIALTKRWPGARAKLLEDKANGPAVEQVLRDKISGIIMMEPAKMGGSKLARANAITPLCEAGDVLFPDSGARIITPGGHTCTYEWVDEMIEEVVTFPMARHDDDVDAMTQALIYMHDHLQGRYLEAMRVVKAGGLNKYFGVED